MPSPPPPPPPASSPPTAPTFLCPLPPPILLSSPKLSSWMGPVFYLRPTQTAPEDQCQLHPLSKPSVEHQGSLLSKHPETSPCLSTLTIRALRSKLEKLSEKKEEQKLPKSYSSCRHTGPNTRSSTSKDPTSSSGSYSRHQFKFIWFFVIFQWRGRSRNDEPDPYHDSADTEPDFIDQHFINKKSRSNKLNEDFVRVFNFPWVYTDWRTWDPQGPIPCLLQPVNCVRKKYHCSEFAVNDKVTAISRDLSSKKQRHGVLFSVLDDKKWYFVASLV